jgi:hypothetical protein
MVGPRRIKLDGDLMYLTCFYGFYIYQLNLPPVMCGDANADGGIDIDDAVFLISYIFAGGDPPDPYDSGDANCSGAIDIDDVVYLIGYIFVGGYAPCDTDGDGVPDC